jgi:hypothetical protein
MSDAFKRFDDEWPPRFMGKLHNLRPAFVGKVKL